MRKIRTGKTALCAAGGALGKSSWLANNSLQFTQLTPYALRRQDEGMKAHSTYIIALHAHAAAWLAVLAR
ncbi:hypothetical protein [uncultured Chitinibacter sp.]|uniref:hypothetical protein n=1 Tax=uncultured Chitinibacter sp. TaxID=1214081 RepID=UPI000646F767|nr:hypothetical protein [uncultured Chitinibacter sp.]